MYFFLLILMSAFLFSTAKADTEIVALSTTDSENVLVQEPSSESKEEKTYKSPYGNLKLLNRTPDIDSCISKHIKDKAGFEKKVYLITSKYGMDYELIMRQVYKESRFRSKAVSPAGARGIAQFMPQTGRSYGLKTSSDFFDPFKSIDAMVHHMSDLYKIYLKDKKLNPQHNKIIAYRLALAAYNAGPRNVKDFKGIPKYRETIQYVTYIYKNINYQPQILH